MSFIGVTLCSISVGIFKLAVLGTDPFTCFVSGFSCLSGLSYGNIYTILNVLMLVGIFFLNRHFIGIATFFNIFCAGYIAQFTMYIFAPVFADAGIIVRVIGMLVGIVLNCFAASIYYTADLGVSTYDAIALFLGSKKVVPFKFCRIGTDLICVLVGYVLMARDTIGVGTIITAFFMGPLIEVFNTHLVRPFLYERPWKNQMIRKA